MENEQLVNEILDAIDTKKVKEKTINQFTYQYITALYETCIQVENGINQFKSLTNFIFNIPCKILKNKINMNQKLDVIFLVSGVEGWCHDELYLKMLPSHYFNPVIVVTPYFDDDKDILTDSYSKTLNYFVNKEKDIYNKTAIIGEGSRIYGTVSEDETELFGWDTLGLEPDILILATSDIEGLRGCYHPQNMPLGMLLAYLPNLLTEQTINAQNGAYSGDADMFNTDLSMMAWKIFTHDEEYVENAKQYSDINGDNLIEIKQETENETIEDEYLKQIYKAIKFAR